MSDNITKLLLVLPLLLIGQETGKEMFNQSKSRVVQDHINKDNTLAAQFRIAQLQLDYRVFTVLNFKVLCKRTRHCWMKHVASVCTPCCTLGRVIGSCYAKFETSQTFCHAQTDATTTFFDQQCCVRRH